jgi:hypothetical protein
MRLQRRRRQPLLTHRRDHRRVTDRGLPRVPLPLRSVSLCDSSPTGYAACCVPYVPTLGPVHPGAFSPDLFDDIIAASQTGRLLPFDRDRRWSDRKDDSVLVGEIIHQPDQTIIPVVSRRAGGTIKTYYYGTSVPDREALAVATRRCATW